uniref:Protein sleepless n=1 Tax=Parastrongyloides trichosuri TaxID=131310 RepID=A0A0N4ZDK3_PARTI
MMLLLYFLLLLFSYQIKAANKCYRCASEHMILQWEKYMPIHNGMSGVADPHCNDNDYEHEIISCNGPCLLLNATAIDRKGNKVFLGVLRDCQTAYWRNPVEVGNKEKECKIRDKRLGGYKVKAEYCFCNSSFCNGITYKHDEVVSYKKYSRHHHSLVCFYHFHSIK